MTFLHVVSRRIVHLAISKVSRAQLFEKQAIGSSHLTAALNINQQICSTVNITVPDFLGCAPNVTSAIGSALPSTGSTTSSSSSSSQSDTAGGHQSTVADIEPGLMAPTATSVVKFKGEAILTGSCTVPQFAAITIAGGFLEYPWLGCSNLYPGCCPYDVKVGGILSVCPSDYETTSSACCPT